jgi:uncharacterized glyoxalase superfamily protein PhnB
MKTNSATTLGGTPVNLLVYVEDCDAVYKKALAAGAKPTLPLRNMFWGSPYGQVTDPFATCGAS